MKKVESKEATFFASKIKTNILLKGLLIINFNLWGNRAFYQLWHFHTNFSLLFIAKLYAAHYSLLPHHTIHPFCVNPNKLTPFVVIKTNPNKTLSAVTLPNLLANGLENKKKRNQNLRELFVVSVDMPKKSSMCINILKFISRVYFRNLWKEILILIT